MKGMALEIRLQNTSSDMAEQCGVAQTGVGCVGTEPAWVVPVRC